MGLLVDVIAAHSIGAIVPRTVSSAGHKAGSAAPAVLGHQMVGDPVRVQSNGFTQTRWPALGEWRLLRRPNPAQERRCAQDPIPRRVTRW